MRICGGRLVRWAGVLLLLSLGPQSPSAAPRLATVLGPEVAIGEPSGGYVGRLIVAPEHGPTGTPVTVTAEGLPAGEEFQLVWRTVDGAWKVTEAEYHGREYRAVAYEIAKVENQPGRAPQCEIPGTGRFRLHARHRVAARRPPVYADRLLHRHDGGDLAKERPGRHADDRRGQGHRLAVARQFVGSALRQQFHRLDLLGDDARLRDASRSPRPADPACTSWRCCTES